MQYNVSVFSNIICSIFYYIHVLWIDRCNGWNYCKKLDTGADFIYVVVLLLKILSVIDVPVWLWIWVIAIAGIKIGNVIYGFIYMGRFMVAHTIMNKFTGILLFLLPLTVFIVEMKYSAMAVCSIATFSAIQEGYYIREGREIV